MTQNDKSQLILYLENFYKEILTKLLSKITIEGSLTVSVTLVPL